MADPCSVWFATRWWHEAIHTIRAGWQGVAHDLV